MNGLVEKAVDCPYCGEKIQLLVDESQGDQRYVEDCSVCCQPMTIDVSWDEINQVCLEAKAENDS